MATIIQNIADVVTNIFVNPASSVSPTIVEIGIVFGLFTMCLIFICESYTIKALIAYSLFVIIIGSFLFSVDEFIVYITIYTIITVISISFIIIILLLLTLIIIIITQKFKK